MDEKEIRRIVLKVLADLSSGQGETPRQRMYLLCLGAFDHRFIDFLQELPHEKYDITAIVPAEWNDAQKEAIRQYPLQIALPDAVPEELDGSVTVVPVVPLSLVVKVALGIDDTFSSQWILRCFGAGSKILLLQSGLQKFTGKEPPHYVDVILGYYRTLLLEDIWIGSTANLQNEWFAAAEATIPAAELPQASSAQPCQRDSREVFIDKRIVTFSDVIAQAPGTCIQVKPDAIVTDYAKERAEALKISFARR